MIRDWLLAWDMGTGKTFVALAYARAFKKRIFVIVPAIAREDWFDTAEKFGFRPMFFPFNGNYSKDYMKYDLHEATCFITSYHGIRAYGIKEITTTQKTKKVVDVPKLRELSKMLDVLVMDECQNIKSKSAQQTKVVRTLIWVTKERKSRIVFMSGTPIINRPEELYTTMKELIPNMEPYRDFVTRYSREYWRDGRKILGQPRNLEELHNRLMSVCSRILKNECLDLPDKVRKVIKISDYAIDVDPLTDIKSYGGWIMTYKKAVAEAKISESVELAMSAYPCIIFTWFIDVNKEITHRLTRLGLRVGQIYSGKGKRHETKQQFQSGELDVLVCGIKAASTAITLTNASNVIFNDLPWTSVDVVQAEDRAHRMGQTKKVTSVLLVLREEFDQMLFGLIESKFDIVNTVLDNRQIEFSEESIYQEVRRHFIEKYKLQ